MRSNRTIGIAAMVTLKLFQEMATASIKDNYPNSALFRAKTTMRSYAYPAVLASRRMMDGRSFIHRRPYFLGWISNQLFRIVLRLADVLLPLRTLYARILQRDRGHERARQRRREKAKSI